jgi:hypothetical protein
MYGIEHGNDVFGRNIRKDVMDLLENEPSPC